MPPTGTSTSRISWVAYAVDEMASDEKTARPIRFEMRWWSASSVASGRPIMKRLSVEVIESCRRSVPRGRRGGRRLAAEPSVGSAYPRKGLDAFLTRVRPNLAPP